MRRKKTSYNRGMIRNLVFDVGGVLCDEVGAHALANLDRAEQDKLADLFYYKSPGFRDCLLGQQSVAEYQEKLRSEYPDYVEEINFLFDAKNMWQTNPIKPEVLEYLHSLKTRYSIYFLSNMVDTTWHYLESALGEFDGGVYSFQERVKKPDARLFQILLDRYTLRPNETLFFDDRERNIDAARKLGINAEIFTELDDIDEAIRKYD